MKTWKMYIKDLRAFFLDKEKPERTVIQQQTDADY
jgi:hypothetical protein